MMTKLVFTTTLGWEMCNGFGCASLGLAGICDNSQARAAEYKTVLEGLVLAGSYADILQQLQAVTQQVFAAIVLFGNGGGENAFIGELLKRVSCPVVGGGAAIDPASGRSALIPGGSDAAVFLITDERYTYSAVTQCIHNRVLEVCDLELQDPRTVQKINGIDAAEYLAEKRRALDLSASDFEHLTLSDLNDINAHLSMQNGVIKSGRDLCEKMILRYVAHDDVYPQMFNFYNDPDAIVFGCAGLAGLLDRPLKTESLGLFLFGEVCTVGETAEFGNLMLSKLIIKQK